MIDVFADRGKGHDSRLILLEHPGISGGRALENSIVSDRKLGRYTSARAERTPNRVATLDLHNSGDQGHSADEQVRTGNGEDEASHHEQSGSRVDGENEQHTRIQSTGAGPTSQPRA